MTEQWLPVVREGIPFPGYEVSNLGRVRTYWLTGCRPRIITTPSLVSGYLTKTGRALVDLRLNGVRSKKQVHLLVLEAFVGPRPEGLIGCHGPTGILDNSLSNLSWKTYSENLKEDKIRDGTDNRGEKNGKAVLGRAEVLKIRRLADGGIPQRRIANMFGISDSNVSMIVRRKNWKWLEEDQPEESSDLFPFG